MRALQLLIGWVTKQFRKWFPHPTPPISRKISSALVIGTAYDQFTAYTLDWLNAAFQDLSSRCGQVLQLSNSNLSKGDVRTAMAKMDFAGRLEIFCGHGDDDALLGPPQANEEVFMAGALHSVIYDTTMVPQLPSNLVAFCCRSAAVLGHSYVTYLDKGFMGFENDLPLDFSPPFMQQLRNIFESICSNVEQVGIIHPNHKIYFENCYDDAITFFMDGEGRKFKDSFIFQLFLAEHRANIRVFSTHLPEGES